MNKYKIAILGCGAIFNRHLNAIQSNHEHFELVGLYDTDNEKLNKYVAELNVKKYLTEDEVYNDQLINCVVILTPSYLHYPQLLKAIHQRKNVIVEKPAVFLKHELETIEKEALQYNVDIFTILQVRLNPALIAVRRFIQQGYFGKIRGISLIQRWQRPLEYFTGWRGEMASGGGILREISIHYLDAMVRLVGMPLNVAGATFYNTKFENCDVYDTVNALLNFGDFPGSIEVTISAEPNNLECSLSLMSDKGFLKLGGKSLDEIITAKFLDGTLHPILDDFNNQALST